MIQNAKLFDILQIPNNLHMLYQELNDFKYMQYLGTQPPLAIISSLIHYSFLQKFDRFTSLILEFLFQSKESKVIQKQLYQSYKSDNPIKEFFQDFYFNQDKANNLNELMVQLCQGMNWDNKTINLTKIAQHFQITILILPERKIYGLQNNQQKLLLYNNNNEQFFFVIPLQSVENYRICQLCRKPCKQYYFKTKCGHSTYCTQCLQLPQFQTYIQCARCYDRTLKSSVQLVLDERILYEKYLNYYKSRINQSQQGIVQNPPQQQNQVQLQKKQNLCAQCRKPEELIDHFLFVDCGHQFCYECLKKCQNLVYEVLCYKCYSSCSKLQVDQYNELYKLACSKNQIENKSKCSQCFKDSDYELFKVQKCNHQFCYDCVNAKIRNNKYSPTYMSCLIKICIEVIDYKDCYNYIKTIGQKKIDDYQNKMIKDQDLQQSVKSECCQSCQQVFPYDLFEVKKCHHKFCTKCVQKWVPSKEGLCPYRDCYQMIKRTEFDEYIQKLQNYSKQGKQETNNQLEDSQSQKKLQIAEINEKSFEQTIEKTKSISQNQELISNKTVGSQQNQLLKQNLTEKELKIETNNESKKETQKESKKEFDAKQLDQTNKIQKNEQKQSPTFESKQEIKQDMKIESKNENHSDESTKNSLPSSDNPLVKKDSKEDSSQDSIKIQQLDNKSKNLQKDQLDQKYKNLSVIKQDAWIEEDSLDTIVIEQIQEFDKQEKEETKGQCSYCSSDFSIYNRKQQVECPIHKIGVCCMLLPYQKCPQCEIVNFKLKHSKAKLNIPKIALEIEYLFDETLPYPTKLYKQIEMDKTHIRQSDYARNNLHTSAQRSSTQDYMQNSRYGSVDNRLNQQLVSQYRKVEPRKENYYEPTVLSSHKPVIYSRQPQQMYRQIQQYSYQRYI